MLDPVHFAALVETVGAAGFVYGVIEFDSFERVLTPPSSAKPLRASTVKR